MFKKKEIKTIIVCEALKLPMIAKSNLVFLSSIFKFGLLSSKKKRNILKTIFKRHLYNCFCKMIRECILKRVLHWQKSHPILLPNSIYFITLLREISLVLRKYIVFFIQWHFFFLFKYKSKQM